MKIEYEVKILDIGVDEVTCKLEELGAEKVAEREMKRLVYDFNPVKENSWIRLRFDGEKNTLTIKEIHNDDVDGTKEFEIVVDDFDKTHLLLGKLGYVSRGYQENKRISYILEGVEIEIDFWPRIPPYLEIEASSTDDVKMVVKNLGFKMSDTTSINTKKVYAKYGIELDPIKELKFE